MSGEPVTDRFGREITASVEDGMSVFRVDGITIRRPFFTPVEAVIGTFDAMAPEWWVPPAVEE